METESERFFWVEQERLRRALKRYFRKSLNRQRISAKKSSWTDEPPIWNEEDYLPVDWDVEGEQEAKIGQVFKEVRRNIRIRLPKEEYESLKLDGVEVKEIGEEEVEVLIRQAILLWEVLRPPEKLPLLPNGKYESSRWKPRVLKVDKERNSEIWLPASLVDCKNWEEIPQERKRVNFCLFLIPDV